MFNYLKVLSLILFSSLLIGCSEEGVSQEKVAASATSASTTEAVEETTIDVMYLPSQVVYQEEIYKNWPYTEAASAESSTEATQISETNNAESVASDKPYQVVDGAISANAIEGWKTYNGGGCGTCHGKGGIGAVGPNLGNSVTTKLSKEQFITIVTNGKSGTLMRPNKTNKRVIDNMDNLYAYLVARGDDVLGPENLIKFPLGKSK